MNKLKPLRFSFKSEPLWMLVFSVAFPIVGLFVFLIVSIVKSVR